MPVTRTKTVDEAQIRERIELWARAVRAKDIDGVMSHCSPGILLFDLAPPLQHRGADAYRRGLEEWFTTFQGPVGLEIRDLGVVAGESVAFCHSLNRISGTRTNREETDVWVRATSCWRKVGSDWLLAHDHVSVPFYMDGSYKAAIDLQP